MKNTDKINGHRLQEVYQKLADVDPTHDLVKDLCVLYMKQSKFFQLLLHDTHDTFEDGMII